MAASFGDFFPELLGVYHSFRKPRWVDSNNAAMLRLQGTGLRQETPAGNYQAVPASGRMVNFLTIKTPRSEGKQMFGPSGHTKNPSLQGPAASLIASMIGVYHEGLL